MKDYFRTEKYICIKAHQKEGFYMKKGEYTIHFFVKFFDDNILVDFDANILVEAKNSEKYYGSSGMKYGGYPLEYKKEMFNKYFISVKEYRKNKLEKLEKICK